MLNDAFYSKITNVVFAGITCVLVLCGCPISYGQWPDAESKAGTVIWLEAEQFETVGGWSNDSQFVDLMGSPYLLATGLGKPVDDAATTARIAKSGRYRLWVRCKDWLPGYSPGQFRVQVGNKMSPVMFGKAETDAWQWVNGATFEL